MSRRRGSPIGYGLVTVVTALAVAAAPAGAQQASGGALVQSYSMSDGGAVGLEGVSLFTLPLTARTRLTRWADVSVSGGWARASATSGAGGKSVVQGPLDTSVRVSGTLAGVLLTAEALVPTGESVQSPEEAAVVGLLSSGLLPFAVNRWGAGWGLGGELGYGFLFGRTRLGLAVGRTMLSSYSPLGESWSGLEPGDQTHVRAVLESHIGVSSVVSAVLGFERFGDESIGSDVVVTPGDRMTAHVSYAYSLGARESAMLFVGLSRRADGGTSGPEGPEFTTLDALLSGTTQIVARQRLAAGGEMVVGRDRISWKPRAEVSLLRSDDGRGQGWIASLGARAAYRLGREPSGGGLVVEPVAAVRLGHVTAYEGVGSGLFGWEAGATVRWRSSGR